MKNTDGRGWDSPVCTWPKCRYRFLPGGGDGHQVIDKGKEHRYCFPHFGIYMDKAVEVKP
jgi:hypothetical protein